MIRQLLILLFLLSFSLVKAQKQASMWYFGNHAGLDFRNGDPVALTDGALSTEEGSATICDEDGNLLFYTDGVTVYNRFHQVMPNGRNLWGSYTTTQTLIVPKPGTDPIYYIFTASPQFDYIFGPGTDSVGFHYSVVDMRLDQGRGDVTEKNILLFKNTTEKVTAAHHANGKDIWVVAHEWGNNVFRAYLVTENGIAVAPIISSIGEIHSGGGEPDVNNVNAIGQMKFSPDGIKLAVAISRRQIIEIFIFNNLSGEIESLLKKLNVEPRAYGLEFSPTGHSLFFAKSLSDCGNNEFISEIYQTKFDEPRHVKVGDFLGSLNAMQLSPDGKIYLALCNDLASQSNLIGVINYPEREGAQCEFKINKVDLLNGRNRLGLPNFVQSWFHFAEPIIEMPNVFTPNGDDFNPLFMPIQFENVLSAELKVFNRWGNEIYYATDVLRGWDGASASAGVYYWSINYTGRNGNQGCLKGWVLLIN